MRRHGPGSRRWDEDEFLAERREVLSTWPTGKALAEPQALEEVIAFHREQPWWKSFALRCARAEEAGEVQLGGYVGHATVEAMVEQLQYCEPYEPALWAVLSDSYTKKNRYQQAQEAIEQSRAKGYSLLSGYPMVCHGVPGARRLVEATRAAMHCDCNDADGRLSWEIALAGGCTCGGAFPLNTAFTKERDIPLQKVIANFRYGDRLAVYYAERGVPIMRASAFHLGGWSAMGMRLAVSVLQALLSAEQGVKYLQAYLSIGANLPQDVAALTATKGLIREYLGSFGYDDVKVYTSIAMWQGDWPLDREAVVAMLAWNVAIGILAGANSIALRSPDESRGTPTKEAFQASFKIARQVQRLVSGQRLPESQELKLEQEMLEKEAKAIVDRTLALGEGDVTLGCVRAVEAGVLDAMFMPYRPLKGKMLVARDRQGALRYVDHGDIPLPAEVLEYHRQKLAEREAAEGTRARLDWVLQDVTRMSSPLLREAKATGSS